MQSNPNVFQSNAAAYTPSHHVPVITLDHAPSLHKSASMSSDEYKFDVVPPVCIPPYFFRTIPWFTGFPNDSRAQLRIPTLIPSIFRGLQLVSTIC